jgi:hypothetical protein
MRFGYWQLYIYFSLQDHIANDSTKDHPTLPRPGHMAYGIGCIVFHGYEWSFFMPVSMVGLSFLPGMRVGALHA